jgi:GMP synthase-like glutamine amidotransferase
MRIHYLQHVPFEDLANIEAWARKKGHEVSGTMLFADEPLPCLEEFDWLVIMGGPMNIYEHDRYPWLAREKDFIRRSINGDKIVFGICLGAQLIADVLGAKVAPNNHKEIGWFPVRLTPEARASEVFGVLPEEFTAFHWHGDTFDIPPGAVRMAESPACRNQAFQLGRAVGLQFHLESSINSIDHLILNCSEELKDGRYVQRPKELLSHLDRFPEIRVLMEVFLNNMEKVLGNAGKH